MVPDHSSTINGNAIKRFDNIDFLKFLGLTGIIIAHVGSPGWAIQLRNFDVTLMVLLSSILGAISFQKKLNSGITYLDFYITRVKRLIIPVWIFLFCILDCYF